ncbi:class I SAM-dependent methyltransferase [Actinokineospora enzanensis]|uniref:class I SAM-dependent methyltransferase n=1 Tax=Actinokineospora enzanensis TaxID=155975 RepID=UPI0003717694|nr:class I SAM-dependent methyltransferase [Actinokineospora enzanensis]
MNTADGVRRVTACRVCGADDWLPVVDLGSVPLANNYLDPAASYADERTFPLGAQSCRSCRLMSLTHVVDPELLYRDYAYVTSESVTITRHMRWVAELLGTRFGLGPGSFVVELGSNTGQQLVEFQRAGMRGLGVDPARNLAGRAAANGVQTLVEFFDADLGRRIARERGHADLVLGRHVFGHVDDLAGLAEGVRELLSPRGVFAIEVPYLLDLLDQTAFDTIYHEHLSYLCVSTMATLFARFGLRVVDVERTAVHGGSVVVVVARAEGPWPTRPSVDRLVELERAAGVFDDGTYGHFSRRVALIRAELPQLLRDLRAGGATIAGYGAPAKGNTVLTTCGIGRDEVSFCIDTTDLKQGKVLPGSHIPVEVPAHARANPPDYFLLLAWNYTDEIVRREREFLAGGGRFIRPIPHPAVVAAGDSAMAG